ncbi:unnamed protein product, partial [Ectocarpus sp. 6 AP-2014]
EQRGADNDLRKDVNHWKRDDIEQCVQRPIPSSSEHPSNLHMYALIGAQPVPLATVATV